MPVGIGSQGKRKSTIRAERKSRVNKQTGGSFITEVNQRHLVGNISRRSALSVNRDGIHGQIYRNYMKMSEYQSS